MYTGFVHFKSMPCWSLADDIFALMQFIQVSHKKETCFGILFTSVNERNKHAFKDFSFLYHLQLPLWNFILDILSKFFEIFDRKFCHGNHLN